MHLWNSSLSINMEEYFEKKFEIEKKSNIKCWRNIEIPIRNSQTEFADGNLKY